MIIEVEGREYMKNATGALVPLEAVKPVDRLRDEMVRNVFSAALAMSRELAEFKKSIFKTVEDFVELSLGEYGVKHGGKKGNIVLTSYDGQYKISVEIQDVLSFDEQLQAAKELVDKCIIKWSSGASSELRALVNDAFQVDKQGNVNTRRILELRRLKITDEDWTTAMEAISNSIKVLMSRKYMRIYQRNQTGDAYSMVPLDFSAL